jgi:hypothetical protein
MPQYLPKSNWNGLDIAVTPVEKWRQRLRFWPYFVGQQVILELTITKNPEFDNGDLKFYVVEKMPDADKPLIIPPAILLKEGFGDEVTLTVQDSSRISGKGEVKYWVSNHGYNLDSGPIFTAEVLNLDSVIIQILLMTVGPLLGFFAGLVLGLLSGN